MKVKSSRPGATGVYELFAAPSPHNHDYSTALPQLSEDENERYPQYAVGNIRMYLVFKYSYYNREKDVARHEAGQDAAEAAAQAKGKPYQRKPFQDKGPSRGTWTWVYSEYNGKEA
jgi:hypothetical protein